MPGALLAALWVILSAGCAAAGGGDRAARTPEPEAAEDWGENWDETGTAAGRSPEAARRESVWTIVLATFPADAEPRAAANLLSQLSSAAPQVADAWTHATPKGSMLVYGTYDSPDSAEAQRDLEMVEQIEIAGRPAFPRAMLTRINLRAARGAFRAWELLSVRQQYRHVDPLYTLQVAIWSDFGSGALTLEGIHRKAEEYAKQLRARGFEAYFHHDDDKRISTVTVGLFDRTAIDSRTGLYGPQVEALLRHFPVHLVNGEQLLEPVDGRNPARGTRVQQPKLVEVPEGTVTRFRRP